MQFDNSTALLTPDDVADRLQVHRDTVRRLLRESRMPGIKISRAWRVQPEALKKWIAERNHDEHIPRAKH